MATKKKPATKTKTGPATASTTTKKTTTVGIAAIQTKQKPIKTVHTSERYKPLYHRGIGDATTRKIEKRHLVEAMVSAGGATLGTIVAAHGNGEALLRIAKLHLRGIVSVAGVAGGGTITHQNDKDGKPGLWTAGPPLRNTLQALTVKNPKTAVKMMAGMAVKHLSKMVK